MRILDVIIIGLVLSIDACTLSISNCTIYNKTLTKKKEWAMPICFGLFQGIMPLIGYYVGSLFSDNIKSISAYVNAGVFLALAIKVLIDIIKSREETETCKKGELKWSTILIQGVTTSIDALVVGVTFSLELTFSVYLAVSIIALVTFVAVACAILFGKLIGKLFGVYSQWIGFALLILLTIKTLFF